MLPTLIPHHHHPGPRISADDSTETTDANIFYSPTLTRPTRPTNHRPFHFLQLDLPFYSVENGSPDGIPVLKYFLCTLNEVWKTGNAAAHKAYEAGNCACIWRVVWTKSFSQCCTGFMD